MFHVPKVAFLMPPPPPFCTFRMSLELMTIACTWTDPKNYSRVLYARLKITARLLLLTVDLSHVTFMASVSKHPMKKNNPHKRNGTDCTVSCEYRLYASSLDRELAGWPILPGARAALSERARAGGVRGFWTLTIWPLGGWFPHWLPLFPANNWDLIWEEISKAPVTPLLCSDRFPSLALKETSLSSDALWRPWVVEGW